MLKNNIEVDVKVKCIEAGTTQAKLAEDVGITPSYVNRLIKKNENIVNKTFIQMLESLGYQTMKEYDRFEKGAANSNTSTAVLKKQLEDPNARIIITTIQKLGIFIGRNKKHPVFEQHVVLIFDECHRSQFGEMHQAIIKAFKKYHLFGFTGTPIFSKKRKIL